MRNFQSWHRWCARSWACFDVSITHPGSGVAAQCTLTTIAFALQGLVGLNEAVGTPKVPTEVATVIRWGSHPIAIGNHCCVLVSEINNWAHVEACTHPDWLLRGLLGHWAIVVPSGYSQR